MQMQEFASVAPTLIGIVVAGLVPVGFYVASEFVEFLLNPTWQLSHKWPGLIISALLGLVVAFAIGLPTHWLLSLAKLQGLVPYALAGPIPLSIIVLALGLSFSVLDSTEPEDHILLIYAYPVMAYVVGILAWTIFWFIARPDRPAKPTL